MSRLSAPTPRSSTKRWAAWRRAIALALVLSVSFLLHPSGLRAAAASSGSPPCAAAASPAAAAALPAVPARRLESLSRGVNFTTLFAPSMTPQRLASDLSFLHQTGLRHVRIPVNPALMIGTNPESARQYIAQLDDGVCASLKAGLAVIVDLHDVHALQLTDQAGPGLLASLASVWDVLAARYSRLPPDEIFFEVANEPAMHDEGQWENAQRGLLQHIRAHAPANTVILTSTPASNFWALAHSQPSSDGNAVYNFHFYTPMLFTHQAAEWATPNYKSIRGLAYPATRDNVASVTSRAESRFQPDLDRYQQDFGDGHKIAYAIDTVVKWAEQHHVPLVATELGVQRQAPDASRAAWFADVRAGLERAHIGWTVWEYEGSFGIKPDLQAGCHGGSGVAAALGLCP